MQSSGESVAGVATGEVIAVLRMSGVKAGLASTTLLATLGLAPSAHAAPDSISAAPPASLSGLSSIDRIEGSKLRSLIHPPSIPAAEREPRRSRFEMRKGSGLRYQRPIEIADKDYVLQIRALGKRRRAVMRIELLF